MIRILRRKLMRLCTLIGIGPPVMNDWTSWSASEAVGARGCALQYSVGLRGVCCKGKNWKDGTIIRYGFSFGFAFVLLALWPRRGSGAHLGTGSQARWSRWPGSGLCACLGVVGVRGKKKGYNPDTFGYGHSFSHRCFVFSCLSLVSCSIYLHRPSLLLRCPLRIQTPINPKTPQSARHAPTASPLTPHKQLHTPWARIGHPKSQITRPRTRPLAPSPQTSAGARPWPRPPRPPPSAGRPWPPRAQRCARGHSPGLCVVLVSIMGQHACTYVNHPSQHNAEDGTFSSSLTTCE